MIHTLKHLAIRPSIQQPHKDNSTIKQVFQIRPNFLLPLSIKLNALAEGKDKKSKNE